MVLSIQLIGRTMESIWQYAKDGMVEELLFDYMLLVLGHKNGVSRLLLPAMPPISHPMEHKLSSEWVGIKVTVQQQEFTKSQPETV